MRVLLDKDFAVEGDEGSIKLVRIHTITGENSRGRKAAADKIGTQRDEVIGFYGNWEQVLSAYINKHSLITKADTSSATEIIEAFKNALDNVKAVCKVAVPFKTKE